MSLLLLLAAPAATAAVVHRSANQACLILENEKLKRNAVQSRHLACVCSAHFNCRVIAPHITRPQGAGLLQTNVCHFALLTAHARQLWNKSYLLYYDSSSSPPLFSPNPT